MRLVSDADKAAAAATVSDGSIPKQGMLGCNKVFQEIAIVAGDLDNKAPTMKTKTGNRHRGICLGMFSAPHKLSENDEKYA